MRVYFDGKEIGKLERPGKIRAGGPAPGCIGSCNGGECFQGMIDELCIYRDALTAEEIRSLWRDGWEAYERSQRELLPLVNTIYAPAKSFAATLAACRKNMLEKGPGSGPRRWPPLSSAGCVWLFPRTPPTSCAGPAPIRRTTSSPRTTRFWRKPPSACCKWPWSTSP